ncbi:peptidylprolyl isomerase [Hyphococcus flavus]|uniref:Parvulin-like PPIase n=1 Tax=Hyphococcus flavus TaxID=1866326 RepID=A0AAE9ZBM6_9PROT|nr:peptidylprolyl isomerase [Hyphococcus flavus]WDI31673.1 peptidylprolyl isomerase [Hyphococcus flavus]
MRFFSICSVGCILFLANLTAYAQQQTTREGLTSDEVVARSGVPASAVAAVVNDAVVTTYDVRQRMRLMLISARGQIPPEAFPQLQAQALQDLVEEQLKIQETDQFEVTVPEREVDQELTVMAAQSNISLSQLLESLKQTGISEQSLRQQVRTDIAWPQLVQGRYQDRVRVSEDEVETTLERMREDANKEQFLLSEVCIPVDNPSQAQQYYQGGLQLIEQMRRGVPFAIVAQQFSACTTAAVGGDMGWVRAGELPPELDTAVRELPVGSVTNPIPSEGAFMILAIRDKREAVVPGEPSFTLAYAGADASMGGNAARAALEKIKTAEICSGSNLRIDLGEGVGYSYLENVTLGQINEKFRPFIEDLSRGDQSAVIEDGGYYHSAYVCDKDEGLGLPSRDALENRIYSRQLSRIGRQYLRDLERESMVDIREENLQPPNG